VRRPAFLEEGRPFHNTYEGLLCGNDRVVRATLREHLTLIPAPARLRRFLATPLYEIMMEEI
jgi:hypothetical protein